MKYLKFQTILLFLILVDLLSFFSYLHPPINTLCFFIISFLTLILSLNKLEYGLYIVLAELFIGSKGYLFSFNLNNKLIFSLRITLFLIVLSVWILKFFEAWLKEFRKKRKFFIVPEDFLLLRKSNLAKWYYFLFIFIVWGFLQGILQGNSFDNVFFDFNAWLFFLLIFVFIDTIRDKKQIKIILNILFASLSFLTLKSIFVLFVFSHQFKKVIPFLYRWLADFYLGEISPVSHNFYRVFFTSQVYVLFAFFIVLSLILDKTIFLKSEKFSLSKLIKKKKIFLSLLFLFAGLTLLLSFSRSYWFGLFIALIIFFYLFKFIFRNSWLKLFKIVGCLIIFLALEMGIVYLLINYPRPPSGKVVSFTSLVEERITKKEAAGISRINQLLPLMKAIARHPLIGSGFGTTITYKSRDPRVVTRTNPEGWYTTYAFEWGYLDIALKIGLAGLIFYFLLILKIFQKGWIILKRKVQRKEFEKENYSFVSLGILLSIIALLSTNIFSPYLNHPLGIGFLILSTTIFSILEKE